MSAVEVVPIGGIELPEDLVAPMSCDCGGEWWYPTIRQVAIAAFGIAPLVAPCCGRRFGCADISQVHFFSKAAWDAAPGNRSPEPYLIGHAFAIPTPRSAA